jgi:hypothetical protein
MKEEKRQHPRIPLPARAWIADGRRTLYLRIHDLSLGGLSVSAPVSFAAADQVELRIELPGGGQVRARGEIRWVRGDGERGPRMGARFLEFHEGEEELFKLFGRA